MNITKILCLLTCLSISQSFAGHQKQKTKPFSKTIDYLNEESNPKFYASMLTTILTQLQQETPQGYRFYPIAAIHFILNDS